MNLKGTLVGSVGFLGLVFSLSVHAQSVSVDVSLSPAGNFKAETKQVTGSAYKKGDGFAAENIIVDIRNLETGVSLRDKHTRKHLGVPKYNSVKLIKASGSGGKGEATIEVMNKQEVVAGTYKVNGSMLTAEFKMTLSGLGIKDVAYMGIGVEDSVLVHVTVPIKEAAAPARAAAPVAAPVVPAAVVPAAKPATKTVAAPAKPRVPASMKAAHKTAKAAKAKARKKK